MGRERNLKVKIFKTCILAQSSFLALVADTQSENIGEEQEYMPYDWICKRCVRNPGFRERSLSYTCK